MGPAFRPQVLPHKALSHRKLVHNLHTSARATPVPSMVYFTVSTTPGGGGHAKRRMLREIGSPTTTMCTSSPRITQCSCTIPRLDPRRGVTLVTLFEESEIDGIGHGPIASIVRMKMVF